MDAQQSESLDPPTAARSSYDGLESSMIERNGSTFPAPASGEEPAISGLEPGSIARLFELLHA